MKRSDGEPAAVPAEESLSLEAIEKELKQIEKQIAARIDELNLHTAMIQEELLRCQAQRDLLSFVKTKLTAHPAVEEKI